MPKASLDLKNPGALENVIIRQVEKLGVGIYPNNALNVEDVIYKLATEVKHSRAMGNRLYTNILVGRLGLIMDYGKFDQRFPVDSTHQIILGDEIERLHRVIRDSKRVIIAGNPGSGKSWLVDEYIDKLKSEDSKVIHYNCFQSLQDTNSLERIRVASLYGNLVSQIVEQCPESVAHKNTIFGADKTELENLLCFVDEEFYLVVDGLDHISREYELHKNLISHSETEIISELLEIHFPDNCYVIISSQPIDEMEEFKGKNYSVFEIEPWGIEQTKSLLATFQINDDTIEDDDISSISAYLLKKSQGNALYLSYILRQLRNLDVNKGLIDEIPDYDINLSKYYSYLYTKVRNNRTVNALCGADFYLSIDDLMEITGDGELLAMLDDMNEFESTGEEYFQAICDIKGASKLNQLMQIDGKPTFDKNTGRLACYISSKAGITPWWKLYLDTDAKQYKIEDFKYYFRYHLDEQGVSIIPKLMEAIEKEKGSIRNQCIEIAYDELQDYIEFDEIASIAEEQKLIHWKNYLYALHAIIEKAFFDRKPELIPQNLLRLMPDYQGMYRLFKCREMQPKNHLYDKNNSCEPFLKNNEDEYILIGCAETRKRIDYQQVSLVFAYRGIVGENDEEHQIPFQQCLATAVEEGEIYMISDNSEALINFISTLDRELEDENYLWPGMSVSKLLNVHIEFDFWNGRYIAVNQENEIIFIMKKWSSSYKGDSEYPGNAIPLYSGTELYIKKEYIGILEQQFGKLKMKTCVQSYTQPY